MGKQDTARTAPRALGRDQLSTQHRNTNNDHGPVIPSHSKGIARLYPGQEKLLTPAALWQSLWRLWTWSHRGIAPSCHSGNTNCSKHQTGGKVTALNSADVHGFGNKLHYPKVECRVCPGPSTQELLKWLHSSVLRKHSLTKRAVPNCSILFPRYSLVYIGVEQYLKKKKKGGKKEKKRQRAHLFPLEQRLLLDTKHFGKYGKTSGAEVWFLGSWGLWNQSLRLQALTFAIHHQNH